MKKSIYEKITDLIIEELEKGRIPWEKPFIGEEPQNMVTKHVYKGINKILLGFYCRLYNYERPLFLTFNQCKKLGGYVKKGKKGFPVVYWGTIEREEENKRTGEIEKKVIPFLKYSIVFNIAQCSIPEDKIPPVKVVNENIEPNERAEQVIKNFKDKPEIVFSNVDKAYYAPLKDLIHLPKKELFVSMSEYYSTLFHELTHSTGHEKRLNRKGVTQLAAFGSESYSKEELIAEMGASFLCAHCGIERNIKNSVAYIQSWLEVLRNDKKMVLVASAQAQKAVDYILGLI